MDNVIEVPLTQIKILPGWNPRGGVLNEDRIKALAEEITIAGQLTPVIVSPTGDSKVPYRLIDGHRRFAAVALNNREKRGGGVIKAIVQSFDNERDAFLAAMMTSLAREDLTSYQTATAMRRARDDYKMSAAELQRRVLGVSKGYSKSHINNLIGCLEQLDAKIVKAWSEEHPACTLHNLVKWKGLDKAAQIAAFEVASEIQPASPSAEGGDKKSDKSDKSDKKPRISRDALEAAAVYLKAAAKEGSLPKSVQESIPAVMATLKWALGATKAIKVGDDVVYDPEAVAAALEEAEQAQREAEEEELLAKRAKEAAEKAAEKVRKEHEQRKADRALAKAGKKSNGKA